MWVSRKKWNELEKKMTALEKKVRGQKKTQAEVLAQEVAEKLEKIIRKYHY